MKLKKYVQKFLNFGLSGYNEIKEICSKIFLDLKLHDIPNTVKNGIKAIEKLKPILTTIHISGGDEMQRLSVLNKNRKVKILGVSILTSLNSIQTKKYYNEANIEKLVKNFVKFAQKNKLDGISSSLFLFFATRVLLLPVSQYCVTQFCFTQVNLFQLCIGQVSSAKVCTFKI